MKREQIHFVTGQLAEKALRDTVGPIATDAGFEYSVQVMPISVAALMSTAWIAPRLAVPPNTTRVILPGYCQGDLSPIQHHYGGDIQFGPKDLRDLPNHFGYANSAVALDRWNIEIIAEINEAPKMDRKLFMSLARQYRDAGADVIDVGCLPHLIWPRVGDCTRELKDAGFRVSIDSLNPVEIADAVEAGAELVLSVNNVNRNEAVDWGVEVVVIPDVPNDCRSMEATMEFLEAKQVPFRIDPILEPIGVGFSQSLGRLLLARSRWPNVEMLAGIGNLTELTDVDSAGVNFLLLGFCEELRIRSVLTTQVINWARSSIRECELARRLVYHACQSRTPPKNLSGSLVALRDRRLLEYSPNQLRDLAAKIRDHNIRLFNADGKIHLLHSGTMMCDQDPFQLFDQLLDSAPRNLDASHAFYIGYELCKAQIALTLGKQYTQDEALDWGYLTIPEVSRRRLKARVQRQTRPNAPGAADPE
jgi:dihydropteroate synthase-like protein